MNAESDYIEAGRFGPPHSFRGEMKFECWCDSPSVLASVKTLYLSSGGSFVPVAVEELRGGGKALIIKLCGIGSDEEAKKYRGKTAYAKKSDFSLEEGRYFICDLIGLCVYDFESGKTYGKLSEVYKYGANDVYEVERENGKKVLIPAVREFVKEIDLNKGIAVSPIGGMFDED